MTDDYLAARPVVIVERGGIRTPFAKAPGKLAPHSLLDLGQHVLSQLVQRLELEPAKIDEVIFGAVVPDPYDSNFARHLVFRCGWPRSICAVSVSNNCITGLVAIDAVAQDIAIGRANVGVAGGAESMSNVPLPMREGAQAFWRDLALARSSSARLRALLRFRPRYLFPARPQAKEPFTGKTMGEHCEEMNREFKIPREVQDEIAARSHHNAARAQGEGILAEEIAPLEDVQQDGGIRAATSPEALARLQTSFAKDAAATLTAGNSSFLTDGASAVCLMAEEEALRQGRKILARLRGVEFAAVDPNEGLLMAPALAVPRLLKRHRLTAADIDLWEVHEAFAAQVAANKQAWEFGWSRYPEISPIGEVPWEKVNVNGGSLAIGHPFAATGARLFFSLARELARRNLRRGVVSACAAGGQGCAMLLERG